MTQVVVDAKNVIKVYGLEGSNPIEVLHGVDMQVEAGEFVAIVGQSGSGKSTMLNMLGALDVPTAGTILVDGANISTLSPNQLSDLRGNTIGFVFQFHYLLDEFTALENAMMPILIQKGSPTREDTRRVKDLMTRVGLESQMNKRPSEMSGGQQQRTAIIRALANQPRLVLADEPTGNLDSKSGNDVFNLMREITREQGVAFIMVTHDDRLAHAADRIVRIEDGYIFSE